MNRLNKICGVLNDLHDALLMIAFVVGIIISVYGFYDVWYVYQHIGDSRQYDFTPDSPAYELSNLPITQEMVGWIHFGDTGINFPVMQGESNLTFLNRDPYGNFSLSGSIFLDSRNSPDFTDGYSLLYGHHMEYGRMFGALRDGLQRRKLTVFAVLRTNAKELKAFDVENPENARRFISENAQIIFGMPDKPILALSTCDGEDDAMRIIVACAIGE